MADNMSFAHPHQNAHSNHHAAERQPMIDISEPAPMGPNFHGRMKVAGYNAPITQVLDDPKSWATKPRTGREREKKDPRATGHRIDYFRGEGGAFADMLAGAKDIDWTAFSAKLPTAPDSDAAAKRKAMFSKFDMNGNGYLSLAEVDKAVRDVLKCPSLFESKPVLMRAFNAAKRASGNAEGHAGDYVEKSEFRKLLQCLRSYFELYAMFNRLDTSDDRKLDLNEWRVGCEEMLPKWGVKLSGPEVDFAFNQVDKNHGGIVLFDEFCEWAIKVKLDLEDDDDFDDYAKEKAAIAGANPKKLPPPPPPPVKAPNLAVLGKARPPEAFVGQPRTPRPQSARAIPGEVGWRGGGSIDRAKSGYIDPMVLQERQQALAAVAHSAAKGFARARGPTKEPSAVEVRKAGPNAQALAAVELAAKRQVSKSLTLEQQQQKAWSAHQNKIQPSTKQISTPRPKHVPSMNDERIGAKTGSVPTVTDIGNFQLGPGRGQAPNYKSGNVREALSKDSRSWRCPRCNTMNRPTSLSCAACSHMRAGGGGGGYKALPAWKLN